MRAKEWKEKVPFTWVRSIPFSAANFFARGLTTTLPPLRGGPAVGAAGAGAAAGWGGGGAAAGVAITLTKNQSHQWNISTAREVAHLIINQEIITHRHKGSQKLNQKLAGKVS